jgi:hypothetical protein
MVKRKTETDDEPPRGQVRAATAPMDYMPPLKRVRGVRMEHLTGFERFARSLWRPAFGWMGVALCGVITFKVAMGAEVPALDQLAGPLGAVIVAMISRTVEKMNDAAG